MTVMFVVFFTLMGLGIYVSTQIRGSYLRNAYYSVTCMSEYEYEYESNVHEIPTRTLLHGTDSTEKRVNMPKWVHQRLREWSELRNRRMTQGVVAYECLLFEYDCFTDEYDRMENHLNEQLRLEDVDVESLDSLTHTGEESIEEGMKSVEDAEETRERIRIWLPESIEEQADWSRGWGEKLGQAVVSVYASDYMDRLDRIDCKKDILQYARTGEEPSHSVAEMVVDEHSEIIGESDEDTYRVETVEDYKGIAGNLDYWQTDRYPALRSLYHSVGSISRDALVRLVCEAHDISDTDHARRKISEFEDEYEDVDFGEDDSVEEEDDSVELSDVVEDEGLKVAIHRFVEDNFKSKRDVDEVEKVFSNLDGITGLDVLKAIDEGDGEYWHDRSDIISTVGY